jgi:hypothetical protein
MKRVYTGAALVQWFLSEDSVLRLLKHNSIGGYSVTNLTEITDRKLYTVRHYDHRSWVVEEVELVTTDSKEELNDEYDDADIEG